MHVMVRFTIYKILNLVALYASPYLKQIIRKDFKEKRKTIDKRVVWP
jgi:hypothetical protein